MRVTTSSTLLSGRPASRRDLRQIGCWRRLTISPSRVWALVTPRITLVRSLSAVAHWPLVASSSTFWATMRLSSWLVSVAGTSVGGMPQAIASKPVGSRKAPRVA